MDVAQGKDTHPLLLSDDRQSVRSRFEYIRDAAPALPASGHNGCSRDCPCHIGAISMLPHSSSTCPCQNRFGSEASWSAVQQNPDAPVACVSECGPACACWPRTCNFSHTGMGSRFPFSLEISEKGLGVHCMTAVPRGSVLFTYAGERLSNRDADARLLDYDARCVGHALLVVRQHLPSGNAAVRFNIDATLHGNVARFVNHRCGDPSAVLVIVWRSGEYMPVVALVSRLEMQIGDEVTWSYGDMSPPERGPVDPSISSPCQDVMTEEDRALQEGEPQEFPQHAAPSAEESRREVCLCGSSMCTGFMPLR
eukprot:jgi/Ulvmu1/6743/UM030_0078.1